MFVFFTSLNVVVRLMEKTAAQAHAALLRGRGTPAYPRQMGWGVGGPGPEAGLVRKWTASSHHTDATLL